MPKSTLNYICHLRTDARLVAGLLRWLSSEKIPQPSVSKGLHESLKVLEEAAGWDRFENLSDAVEWLGDHGFLVSKGDPDRVRALAKGIQVKVRQEREREMELLTSEELERAFDDKTK